MLIKCPKCGFDQPQDEYCARCGVHIPSFQSQQNQSASASSLTSRWQFWLVLFALFISVTVVATHFLKKREIEKRKASLQRGIPLSAQISQKRDTEHLAQSSQASPSPLMKTSENLEPSSPSQTSIHAAAETNLPSRPKTPSHPKMESSPKIEEANRQQAAMATEDKKRPNTLGSSPNQNQTLKLTSGLIPNTATQHLLEQASRYQLPVIETDSMTQITLNPQLKKLVQPLTTSWLPLKTIDLEASSLAYQWLEGVEGSEEGFYFALSGQTDISPPRLDLQLFIQPKLSDEKGELIHFPNAEMEHLNDKNIVGYIVIYQIPRHVRFSNSIAKQKFFHFLQDPQFLRSQSQFAIYVEFASR
ncbi:MAG: hypothetical protein NZ480_07505 [Bdellovibrionaceae bacterium]|nr:hypothetical protein [Pseudobdellovibrionaceae bacterium]MDW8189852.1 hypothetical protein [Pseudobdellovibrionaceae bacterium]